MDSADRYYKKSLGKGLMIPFQRLAGSDFVSGMGIPLVNAAVTQIMGTKLGELPWRPSFGQTLEQYKHLPATMDTAEIMLNVLIEAVQANEPRLNNINGFADIKDNKVRLRLDWTVNISTPANASTLESYNEKVVELS